jgi:hypothetical protein
MYSYTLSAHMFYIKEMYYWFDVYTVSDPNLPHILIRYNPHLDPHLTIIWSGPNTVKTMVKYMEIAI